jgi:hypothetical protein
MIKKLRFRVVFLYNTAFIIMKTVYISNINRHTSTHANVVKPSYIRIRDRRRFSNIDLHAYTDEGMSAVVSSFTLFCTLLIFTVHIITSPYRAGASLPLRSCGYWFFLINLMTGIFLYYFTYFLRDI